MTVKVDGAAVGREDTGDGPQEGGLATAVLADDAQDLALFQLEADVLHRLHHGGLGTLAAEQAVLQREGLEALILDTEIFYFDCIFAHIKHP